MRKQVVISLEIDHLLSLLALRDVSCGAIGASKALAITFFIVAVDAHGSQLGPHRLGTQHAPATVENLALQSHFDVFYRTIAGTPFVKQVIHGLQIVIVDELGIMFAEQLFLGVPKQTRYPVVQKAEAAVAIKHVHQIRGAIDNETVEFLRFLDLAFHRFMLILQANLAQGCFHGCDELRRFVGLFDEVEGAAMQSMFDPTEAGIAADDDDLAAQLFPSRIIEDVVTADTRHDQVKQHHVIFVILQCAHRGFATQCLISFIAVQGNQVI